MMTLVFEDHAAALAALQPHKSLGENDALWGNTASALHACCQGHPWWLIINGAGTAVTTMQKLVSMKIQCASGTAGKYRGGTNWGQPMLVQDRVVLMWQTDINHTSERASVQLIEVASTISISALNANEIALITGCVHLPRGGVDPGATFPHAIVATTLISDERSSGGSEGWRKSGAGAESWGEATAAVSYVGPRRAVDTPDMSGWQTLVAVVKAEAVSGKELAGAVEGVNELGYSSLGSDIDRLELLGYRVDDRVVGGDITDRLATSAAMLSVYGAASDDFVSGGGPGYSDARRRGAWMVAKTSPDALDVVRQVRSRYDTCCDFQGMPTAESLMTSAAPQPVSGDGPGGVPVGEVLSPDGAPMPHSHETHLSAAASRPEALHVGGSVSQTRSGSPSAGAEPEWGWDRRAGMQEVLVPGSTAAQAISLHDGALVSHSHVGGSDLQTHGIVAAMRLRGGGWSDEQAHRRHEAEYQRAKERSGEAAGGLTECSTNAEGMATAKGSGGWCGSQKVTSRGEDPYRRRQRKLHGPLHAVQRRGAEPQRRWLRQRRELETDARGRAGKRNWEGVEAAEGSEGKRRWCGSQS